MNIFATPDELAEALAARVAGALAVEIAAKGAATLAVSGGSTPRRFFTALSRVPLDWPRVTVTLVDERCVPEESPRSNAGLVRAHLLQGPAAAASFVPMQTGIKNGLLSLRAACGEAIHLSCNTKEMDGFAPLAMTTHGESMTPPVDITAKLPLPLTVAVLGMGLDGHTASFFPGGGNLAQALDPNGQEAVLPMTAPGADEPRLTLTLPVLVGAKLLALHIEGAAKRDVLARAQNLPINAVLAARPDIEIFWSP